MTLEQIGIEHNSKVRWKGSANTFLIMYSFSPIHNLYFLYTNSEEIIDAVFQRERVASRYMQYRIQLLKYSNLKAETS